MALKNSRSQCGECGSSDGWAEREEGGGYCFSCEHTVAGSGGTYTPQPQESPFLKVTDNTMITTVDIRPLGSRRIDKKTCEKYGYGFGEHKGKEVAVGSHENEAGEVVAQQIRSTKADGSKQFLIAGDASKMRLWGITKVRPNGRMLIITEGYEDCMAVSQVFGNKYPVVSLPRGTTSAKAAIKQDLKWISGFEKVVLCFDEDPAGKKAITSVRHLFKPGTLFVARLPLNDPCEMLKAHRSDELYRAIWDAPQWTPSSLLHGEDLWADAAKTDDEEKVGPYPWEGLNNKTAGMRYSEITMWCAGSGIGKTTFTNEVAGHLLSEEHNVCVIGLESKPRRTVRALATVHATLPMATDFDESMVPALEAAAKDWGDRLWVFDGWGYNDVDALMNLIRWAAKGLDCRTVILDHVSIIVSGMDTDDERRSIDTLMTALRSMVEEAGINLQLVSHLKRPSGKGHEDGGEVSLSQLRGSASLAQLSDMVIGLERNQQDMEEDAKNTTCIKVLKNRYNGRTGRACYVRYSEETGRLSEFTPDETDNNPEDSDFS